jgi:hypothetical protein
MRAHKRHVVAVKLSRCDGCLNADVPQGYPIRCGSNPSSHSPPPFASRGKHDSECGTNETHDLKQQRDTRAQGGCKSETNPTDAYRQVLFAAHPSTPRVAETARTRGPPRATGVCHLARSRAATWRAHSAPRAGQQPSGGACGGGVTCHAQLIRQEVLGVHPDVEHRDVPTVPTRAPRGCLPGVGCMACLVVHLQPISNP